MEDKREYSAIEIEIANNLIAKGCEWLARDRDNRLNAYKGRPVKGEKFWGHGWDCSILMDGAVSTVIPLFESIRWEDEDPVRLRDVAPQILTDEEKEWLRTVVKPFRDRLKSVEAHDGIYYGRYVELTIVPPEKWRDDIGKDEEYTPLPVSKVWFKGMENFKNYAPEELGI